MKQKSKLLCLTLLISVILQGTFAVQTAYSQETPTYGGRLVVARYEDTVTFNPVLAPGITSLETTGLIFDGLMRLDSEGMPKPALATGYTLSSDGLVYTFTLRQNVLFHDGVELTADDVKFTFDQAIFNKSVTFMYRSYYEPVASIVAADKYTVEFHLNHTSGSFISWMNLPIIPKHIYDKGAETDLNKDSHNFDPIGTGPFKFVEWVKDDHLVLAANENYWNGKPYLNEVVFRVIPDPATMALALERGEIDFARDISFADTVRLQEDGSDIEVLLGPANYIVGIRGCFQSDYFNKTDANSLKLRQAIGYALDREGISRSIYYGLASTAHSPLPEAYPFWNNEVMATGKFVYDAAKANQILDEIYPKGADGYRLELELAGATVDRDYLELVKTQLEAVGIKIRLNLMEKSAYWAHIQKPYEIGMWTWVAVPDPGWVQNSYASWTTSAYTKTHLGLANDTGSYLSSGPATEIDELLTEAEKEADANKRQDLYYRFQEIIGFEDPSIIFTNFKPWPHAYRSDLHGIQAVPMMLYETTLSNSLPKAWLEPSSEAGFSLTSPISLAIIVAIVVVIVVVIALVLRKRKAATKSI